MRSDMRRQARSKQKLRTSNVFLSASDIASESADDAERSCPSADWEKAFTRRNDRVLQMKQSRVQNRPRTAVLAIKLADNSTPRLSRYGKTGNVSSYYRRLSALQRLAES